MEPVLFRSFLEEKPFLFEERRIDRFVLKELCSIEDDSA